MRSSNKGGRKRGAAGGVGSRCWIPRRKRGRGVVVTTIFPGFVQTPLLDGLMAAGQTKVPPGAIDADTCAGKIIAAVRRGKRVASFPWSTSRLVALARFLPPLLYDRLMTRMAARIKLPY